MYHGTLAWTEAAGYQRFSVTVTPQKNTYGTKGTDDEPRWI